jgi:hypothetical protein
MVTDSDKSAIYAMVDGKIYSTWDYRPIHGDGRQLREQNRKAISSMMDKSLEALRELSESDQQFQDYWKEMGREEALAEMPKNEPIPQPSQPSGGIGSIFEQKFLEMTANLTTEKVVETVMPKVQEKILEEYGPLPQVIRVEIPGKSTWEKQGVILHHQFDKILSMVMCGESVYLCGPAGTGKSFLAEQVAEALDLEYYYTSNVTDDVQLKGFIDANGNYHATQFYQAFTKGGLFLLDELDASCDDTATVINNALSNGYFDFPGGERAKIHPDFHCMASGNTYGTGADDEYTGRYRLDASTLDRFAMVKVDYSREISLNMAMGDESLVDFSFDFRRAAKEAGISCLFTYRAVKRLAKFTSFMTKEEAIEIGLTKGLEKEDVAMIARNMQESEWKTALENVGRGDI